MLERRERSLGRRFGEDLRRVQHGDPLVGQHQAGVAETGRQVVGDPDRELVR
jgi:hypothetical protein